MRDYRKIGENLCRALYASGKIVGDKKNNPELQKIIRHYMQFSAVNSLLANLALFAQENFKKPYSVVPVASKRALQQPGKEDAKILEPALSTAKLDLSKPVRDLHSKRGSVTPNGGTRPPELSPDCPPVEESFSEEKNQDPESKEPAETSAAEGAEAEQPENPYAEFEAEQDALEEEGAAASSGSDSEPSADNMDERELEELKAEVRSVMQQHGIKRPAHKKEPMKIKAFKFDNLLDMNSNEPTRMQKHTFVPVDQYACSLLILQEPCDRAERKWRRFWRACRGAQVAQGLALSRRRAEAEGRHAERAGALLVRLCEQVDGGRGRGKPAGGVPAQPAPKGAPAEGKASSAAAQRTVNRGLDRVRANAAAAADAEPVASFLVLGGDGSARHHGNARPNGLRGRRAGH